MDYGYVHNGNVYTPNRTPDLDPAESDARNADIERAELTDWQSRPMQMWAYYRLSLEAGVPWRADFRPSLADATIVTWLGTRLGTIIRAHVYRHNFGGRQVALTVRGTNGAIYHGRASYDNGTCINLRRAGHK